MNIHFRYAVLACILVLQGIATTHAQNLTCTSAGYISTFNGQRATKLSSVDQGTVTPLGDASGTYNALGFNVQDGFLYALGANTREVFRIGSNGGEVRLGTPAGLPGGVYPAGAVNNMGNLLLFTRDGGGLLVEVAGLSGTPTVVGSTTITFPNSTTVPALDDIAFNPRDGRLYGYDNANGQVVRIDQTTGLIDLQIPVSGGPVDVGGVWFDPRGFLYTLSRFTGLIYRVNLLTGQAVLEATGPGTNGIDAAACGFAPSLELTVAPSPVGPGQVATITFTIYNPTPTPLTGLTLGLNLPGTLTFVPGSLNDGGVGGTPNAFGNTATFSLSGLTVPANGVSVVTVQAVSPVNTPSNSTFNLQATLGGLPGPFLATIESDNPATGAFEDPTPLTVALPADALACSATPLLALVGRTGETTLALRADGAPSFNLDPLGATSVTYNAIGYNPGDGYVYGLDPATRILYRVNATGTATALGVPVGMPLGTFFAGTIGPDGTMYTFTRSSSSLVHLNGLSSGSPTVTKTVTVPGNPGTADLAYNPADGDLYGYNNRTSEVVRINPATGALTVVAASSPAFRTIAGVWFDGAGGFYGYDRSSGNLIAFDLGTGAATTEVTVRTAAEGDATSCPFAPASSRIAAAPVTPSHQEALPAGFAVSTVYPNPFNPTATFEVRVARQQRIAVRVYDALGREVARPFEGTVEAGVARQVVLDGQSLASGLYLVRVIGESFSQTQRVTLLK